MELHASLGLSKGKDAGSQQVVVVQQFGVLTALPQTEQAEVEVYLDHLLPCTKTRRNVSLVILQTSS